MVLTLAVLILTAMMTTTIVASSILTVKHTTATRANVEAVAAAEAGAQLVAKGLIGGTITCAGTYSSPAGSTPEYQVTVDYVARGAAANAWTNGCPPADVAALRVRSTGVAQAKGVGGSTRDVAQAEILFDRPNPIPRFTKALFGDVNMNINTALTVTPSDGDLFTNGNYTCSSNSVIGGSIYVRGNATFSSAPCTVDGSVIVEGNFTCGGGLTIGGDLFVQGTVLLSSATCRINGNVWSGSWTRIPNGGTPIGGDLTVRGNLELSGLPTIAGATKVRGTLAPGQAYWASQFLAAYPGTTQNDTTVGYPPTIPASDDNIFPKVPRNDPMFSGWTNGNWVSAINNIRSSGPASCDAMTWGSYAPLVINTNTVFDTIAQCGNERHLGANLTIRLNADAVIFAPSFKVGGNVRVESGDGQEHTLYLVVPWPAGQVNCNGSGGNFRFEYGSWTQDSRSKVLIYTPNKIEVAFAPQIRGQLYSCSIDANTAFSVQYAPAGTAVADNTLEGLDLTYMRDVTS